MQTLHKTDGVEAVHHEDNGKGTDGSATDNQDPWDPPDPPYPSLPPHADTMCHLDTMKEYAIQLQLFLADHRATKIIAPDRTPQKIFLDTTRLLANHTDNVVDELWNYIKDGKLIHTAILLLAAQRQIRIGGSCKRNGNSNLNGFDIIKDRIVESMVSLETEGLGLVNGKNRKARNGLVLVIIFSQTGEALDAYIQTHSEVSHQEVLESVSSILQNYGFTPSGKGIDIGDLYCCPYDSGVSDKQLGKHGDTGTTKAAIESPSLNAEAKNVVGKKLPSGEDLVYTRTMFFPHWRSVLRSRFTIKVFPSYVPIRSMCQVFNSLIWPVVHKINRRRKGGSSPVHVGLLGRTPQLASNNQSRRLLGTAAFTLLRMLKRA